VGKTLKQIKILIPKATIPSIVTSSLLLGSARLLTWDISRKIFKMLKIQLNLVGYRICHIDTTAAENLLQCCGFQGKMMIL